MSINNWLKMCMATRKINPNVSLDYSLNAVQSLGHWARENESTLFVTLLKRQELIIDDL